MTHKETQAFSAELQKMDAVEVRENTDPDIQPDSIKRSMAVTELERRRQLRAPSNIQNPICIPLFLILFAAIAAATGYWLWS